MHNQEINYNRINELKALIEKTYLKILYSNPIKFKIPDGLKQEHSNVRNDIFKNALFKQLDKLGIVRDVKNLNLNFQEFEAKDTVLKHQMLTVGDKLLSLDNIYTSTDENIDLIENLVKKINNLLSEINNNLNPMIKGIVETVKAKIEQSEVEIAKDGYEVTRIVVPEFVKLLQSNDMLIFNNQTDQDFSIVISKPYDYTDFLPNGLNEISASMKSFLEEFSEKKLKSIYDKYIRHINTMDEGWRDNICNYNECDDYEDLFIVYVFVYHMKDVKITLEETTVDNNIKVDMILNKLNKTMQFRLDNFIFSLKDNQLILSTDGKNIFVNTFVLERGFKENVDIDVLFGNMIKNNKPEFRLLKDIVINSKVLREQWFDYSRTKKILYQNRSLENNKLIIMSSIKEATTSNNLTDKVTDNEEKMLFNRIEENDLVNIEQTVIGVVVGMTKDPYYYAFYDYVKELKGLNHDNGDIKYYVSLAVYKLIVGILIKRIKH